MSKLNVSTIESKVYLSGLNFVQHAEGPGFYPSTAKKKKSVRPELKGRQ